MPYSLSLLKTRAQCDALLEIANEKIAVLTFRGQETVFRTTNAEGATIELSNELNSLNTYITAITPALATMDASNDRDALGDELRRKTDRRDELMRRQTKSGPELLVERELEKALLEPQLPIVQDLITEVTAHRATLTA
ncbi:hypothetical protein [Hymenobacter lucidus]|uniref:Uncharacterized protein n=1 Tax=Hymenobacter lucidus TaxID=2880930 RepID=A0ABS8AUU8_9BACT|nr:hypothetical protein [Hymenobacter lucidus]MCB2409141.1 hypothetical protein [Hymenobacter lucidus]